MRSVIVSGYNLQSTHIPSQLAGSRSNADLVDTLIGSQQSSTFSRPNITLR